MSDLRCCQQLWMRDGTSGIRREVGRPWAKADIHCTSKILAADAMFCGCHNDLYQDKRMRLMCPQKVTSEVFYSKLRRGKDGEGDPEE